MTSVPPLDPVVRQAIRHRARSLRRRRRAVLAVAAGAVVAAAVVPAVALSGSSKPKPAQLATSGDCPAADVPVQVRVGATASLTRIPQGWSLISGSSDQPQTGLTYASAADEGKAQQMGRYTSYSASSVSLSVTFPPTGLPVPSSTGTAPSHPVPTGTKTATTTINGFTATDVTTFNGPAGQTPSPAYPQNESISWAPAPATTVNVAGTNIPHTELLDIARGATYQAGTVIQLPATPTYTVTATKAEKVLPAHDRAGAHAALSSWAEVEAVGGLKNRASADYRPVWLVHSTAGAGRVTWAIVDARSGQVLQPPTTTADAGWVYMVTDRSQPGCQPPLGIPTRSEMAQIEFSGPAPAGYKLLLTTGPDAQALVGGSGRCDLACDPLVWIAYRLGTQIDVKLIDALTMRPIGEISGPGPLQTPLPEDLDPGSTPTGPAGAGPTMPPAVPNITKNTAPTTSVPIVGPSPYYPGTTNPKPAPAGNGKGPGGSCNGTETYPPCGPGVVEHQYYPYTLPSNCTGYLYFDGRWWQQELYEPNQPTENVWMVDNGGGAAGWVGPGAVGIAPAPPGPPPACGTTPASVPSLPTSG